MENQENEIIELAEYQQPEEIEEYEEAEEAKTGMGTGWAMLIGGLITAAGIAGVKYAKKKYGQFKARKAMVPTDASVLEDMPEVDDADDDFVDAEVDDANTK